MRMRHAAQRNNPTDSVADDHTPASPQQQVLSYFVVVVVFLMTAISRSASDQSDAHRPLKQRFYITHSEQTMLQRLRVNF